MVPSTHHGSDPNYTRWSLLAIVCVGLVFPCWGFIKTRPFQHQHNRFVGNNPNEWIGTVVVATQRHQSSLFSASSAAQFSTGPEAGERSATVTLDGGRKPCFYKSPKNNRWKPRLELSELQVGQELPDTVVVQELLDGRTGPKLFCEVGVGRCSADGQRWKIVNAMLRMGNRGTKKSVVAKRAARLRSKTQGFPVYVSRIRLENDQLEVCLDRDEVVGPLSKFKNNEPERVSVSSWQVGQTVTGTVVRVESYGVLVDVGANRHGLLHITRVAKLMRRRIENETGLKDAGLAKGSRVQLQVASNQRKRLFLDFTDEVKEMAAEEFETKNNNKSKSSGVEKEPADPSSAATAPKETIARMEQQPSASPSSKVASIVEEEEDDDDYYDDDSSSSNGGLSPEEEAAWAAYAEGLYGSSGNVAQLAEEEEYDDYDEDRDIEDAFGMGTY